LTKNHIKVKVTLPGSCRNYHAVAVRDQFRSGSELNIVLKQLSPDSSGLNDKKAFSFRNANSLGILGLFFPPFFFE
jgi:hypothetical protein